MIPEPWAVFCLFRECPEALIGEDLRFGATKQLHKYRCAIFSFYDFVNGFGSTGSKIATHERRQMDPNCRPRPA